jgi:hypothetical protein
MSIDVHRWPSMAWMPQSRHEVLSTSGIFTCSGPKHLVLPYFPDRRHVCCLLCNFHGLGKYDVQVAVLAFCTLIIWFVERKGSNCGWQFSHLAGVGLYVSENVTSGKRSRIAPLDTQKLDLDMFGQACDRCALLSHVFPCRILTTHGPCISDGVQTPKKCIFPLANRDG